MQGQINLLDEVNVFSFVGKHLYLTFRRSVKVNLKQTELNKVIYNLNTT